jgi:ribosome-associated protein
LTHIIELHQNSLKKEVFLDSLEKSIFCARLADDKQAKDLIVLELKQMSCLADYFIICTGTSERHVQALASHIEANMKQLGELPLGIEGVREGKWVLLDYNDVIIHVFLEEERQFYDLENLWNECPHMEIPELNHPD